MAFRPVWVRSRSKQRFHVGDCCSVVVEYPTSCSSQLVCMGVSNLALGNELVYVPSDRS